eukprot:TRINITY_DN3832_c1_g1_i4.p1 TRINITY_DN3832_c1_g1~~TRINITY_DN3832_c1_g1_i4.p1  ORF type:complete len:692 (+),score=110.49 TRINITY_DN3832_c1_g1_i4:97-2172(+)
MTIFKLVFGLLLFGVSPQPKDREEYFQAYGDYFDGINTNAPLAIRKPSLSKPPQNDTQPPMKNQTKNEEIKSTLNETKSLQNDTASSNLSKVKDLNATQAVNATKQEVQQGDLNNQPTALNETTISVSNSSNSNNASHASTLEGDNSTVLEPTISNDTTSVGEFKNEQSSSKNESVNSSVIDNRHNDTLSDSKNSDINQSLISDLSRESSQNGTSLKPLSDQLVTKNDTKAKQEADKAFTSLEEAISEAVNQTDDSNTTTSTTKLEDLTHTDKTPVDGVAEVGVKDLANNTITANTTKYVHTGFNDEGDAENSVGTQIINSTQSTYNNGTHYSNSTNAIESVQNLSNTSSVSNDTKSESKSISTPVSESTKDVGHTQSMTPTPIKNQQNNQTSLQQTSKNETEQDIMQVNNEDTSQNISSNQYYSLTPEATPKPQQINQEPQDQETPLQQLGESPQDSSSDSQQVQPISQSPLQYNQSTKQGENDDIQMLSQHQDKVQKAEEEQQSSYFANLGKLEQNVSQQDLFALEGLRNEQVSQSQSDEVSRPAGPDGFSIPSAILEKERQYKHIDNEPNSQQQQLTMNTQMLDENQIQDISEDSDFSSMLLMGAVGLFIFVALLYYISKWMRSSSASAQYSSLTTYSGEGGLGGGSMKPSNTGSNWDKGWDEGWGKDDEGQHISKRRGKGNRGADFI